MKIDARGLYYRDLNHIINEQAASGVKEIELLNVNGQRYIGTGCKSKDLSIKIQGVPGNDLGIFMDGPTIEVFDNAQDGVGTTMNSGRIIIHGDAGDVLGYGMRGGELFIRGNVGYRVGIHMKGFKEMVPIMVVGGTAGNFCAEYMAGGILILLGLDAKGPIAGDYLATGMHGGVLYLRGEVADDQLGKEVKRFDVDEKDKEVIENYVSSFCKAFALDASPILKSTFIKLIPVSARPYGKLYAY